MAKHFRSLRNIRPETIGLVAVVVLFAALAIWFIAESRKERREPPVVEGVDMELLDSGDLQPQFNVGEPRDIEYLGEAEGNHPSFELGFGTGPGLIGSGRHFSEI